MSTPVGQYLDAKLRVAERHLSGGRAEQAVDQLEQGSDRLERPDRGQVTPAAQADLLARIQQVVDVLS